MSHMNKSCHVHMFIGEGVEGVLQESANGRKVHMFTFSKCCPNGWVDGVSCNS